MHRKLGESLFLRTQISQVRRSVKRSWKWYHKQNMHFCQGTKPYRKKGSLGVEHASDEAILEALKKVVTPVDDETQVPEITRQMLVAYGLIAGAHAKEKREMLGDELRIGYTNGKQLEKRLNMFRITLTEFKQAMKKVEDHYE